MRAAKFARQQLCTGGCYLSRCSAIPPEQVFRIHGEYDDCRRAADEYEAVIRDVFDLGEGVFPCFDLITLGLGQDGHIASLLPGDVSISISDHLTWPVYHETRLNRVTLTAPVLQNARKLLVMVYGTDKAEIVQTLFTSPPDVLRYPAYVLWPVMDNVLWLTDEDAASRI
jgi:6-phosphogluconolactonase